MNIDIFLLEDYTYQANTKSIPVVVRLSSLEKIEISEKIDIREILLYKGDEAVFGGYIRCRFGKDKDTLMITERNPHHILYDICDYDDNEIYPGEYEINIWVQVYRFENNTRAETINLKAKCQLKLN